MENKIEKSALALIEIYKLIGFKYGGNVTSKDWHDSAFGCYCNVFYGIAYNHNIARFEIVRYEKNVESNLILFRADIYASNFLREPNNVRLLKDYFML